MRACMGKGEGLAFFSFFLNSYAVKMKQFGLGETELFQFRGILKKLWGGGGGGGVGRTP